MKQQTMPRNIIQNTMMNKNPESSNKSVDQQEKLLLRYSYDFFYQMTENDVRKMLEHRLS